MRLLYSFLWGSPRCGNGRRARRPIRAEPKGRTGGVYHDPARTAGDGTVVCSGRPAFARPTHPASPQGAHVPASTLLLLDADLPSREVIRGVLAGVGYSVTAVETADEAFRLAGDHQLMIINVVTGKKTAADICREIRQTPALSAVPVLCISQSDDVEDRIRFLEAGADDVMAKPFDARELEARVEALLLRFQRSRDLAPALSLDGAVITRARRSVAVFSPKGGVGTTTIATNIAVAAAAQRPNQVVLVDLALQFGGVATHLNMRPRQTLA